MTIYHKDLAGSNVHTLVRWEFNDASARAAAAGLVAGDIGKLAWQKDNDTFWILKNHVGPAWAATGAPFGTTAGTACEGNDSRLSDARTPVAHNQDASTITTGIFDIARLPAGALDRLVIVTDEAARFALTTASVQTGDTVKQTSPAGTMYRVIDDTKLDQAAGYVEYAAARAAAVDWTGVENKPASFTPANGTTLVVGAHGAAATDQVVNVCYGTGTPPTASTTTEGALFIKYTA